jgi:hypothetical protein
MENYTVYLVDKKVEVASDFLKPKLNAAGYLEAKPYFQSLKEFKNLDALIFIDDYENPIRLELKSAIAKSGNSYLTAKQDIETNGNKFNLLVNVTIGKREKKKIFYAATFLLKTFPPQLDKRFLAGGK